MTGTDVPTAAPEPPPPSPWRLRPSFRTGLLFALVFACPILLFYHALAYAPVNTDAGTYLGSAEAFQWLAGFGSPDPRRLGYGFLSERSLEERFRIMAGAKSAIVMPLFLAPDDPWYSILEAAGYRPVAEITTGAEVWLKEP